MGMGMDVGAGARQGAHPRDLVAACTVLEEGAACGAAVLGGSALSLCADHLLAAHEIVVGAHGTTDVLPSPCRACGARIGVRYPSGWLCGVCEWRVGDEPDSEIVTPRVDVVYYLRFRDRIKIGTTANPRQRFAALRFDALLAFERGDRLVEQRRHQQFAALRFARTEWFAAERPLLDHVLELRAGVDDPWARLALWVSHRLALAVL